MPKVLELDPEELAKLAAMVEAQAPEGPIRNAYKLRYLYGRDVFPSRHAWIEAFCKIEDKVKGTLIPFKFNRVQRRVEAWRLRCERANIPQRAIILKSRHHGISTQFVAYGQEEALRNRTEARFRAGIVAQEEDTGRQLLENGKLMRDNFPWKLPHRHDNRSVLWYDAPIDGYVDILSANTKHAGRGKHYRFLHMTEVAFWKDPEGTFVALSQTVPQDPGTVQSIETTANGAGGWFYEFFWAAWEGKNEYQAMFFPWMDDPALAMPLVTGNTEEILDTLDDEEKELLTQHGVTYEQLKWRRWAVKNLCGGSLDLFHQEYPSTPREAFLTSGRPVFLPTLVERTRDRCIEPRWVGDVHLTGEDRSAGVGFKLVEGERGSLKVWAHPIEGETYCMASDSAEGIGKDYCAIEVAHVQTGCQVAEYACNSVNPNEFGKICVAIGRHYNSAWWLPEVNPPGNATMQVGLDHGYDRVLRQLIFGRAGHVVDTRLGWRTKEDSKRLMVKEISIDLGGDNDTICSQDLAQEIGAYQITEEGRVPKYSAPKGAHDDLVIAWGINRMARRLIFEQNLEDEAPKPKPLTMDQLHWQEWEEATQEDPDDEEEGPWD